MDLDLLKARISDTIDISNKTSMYKRIGFLSEEEIEICNNIAAKQKARFCFFGGYTGAKRQLFVALPEWADSAEDFNIVSALTFSFKKEYTLAHRDFLGALMSVGLTRESIGDILTESGRAVVFCLPEVAEYIKQQITKVGNVGVIITDGYTGNLPNARQVIEKSASVASMRLDNVVSAITNCSRNKAQTLIEGGFVKHCSVPETKITATVKSGDSVSVKGFGRFNILGSAGQTKSGRSILKFSKYI